jgi:hypothetical protein
MKEDSAISQIVSNGSLVEATAADGGPPIH